MRPDLPATRMTPTVTIIVPLKHQKDQWLEQSVQSAMDQAAPCEVIVVHSKDTPPSNLAVLANVERGRNTLRVVVEEKPGSFPAAINLGIRAASTPRIGLLLSDDWLDRSAVAKCLPVDADIVCTGQATFAEDGVTVFDAASRTLTMETFLALPTTEAKARYLSHFFLFRKEILLRAGMLDESIGNYPGIDDYDLIWTLLDHGASVGIVEERLYNYRDHDGDRLTLANAREAALNLEKILRKHGIPAEEIHGYVQSASKWFGKPIYKALGLR